MTDIKPGRELDLIIAEKFFGLHIFDTFTGTKTPVSAIAVIEMERQRESIPRFSTDIAAAWLVVEKFFSQPQVNVYHMNDLVDGSVLACRIRTDKSDITARGVSAPHAICLAALKAVT